MTDFQDIEIPKDATPEEAASIIAHLFHDLASSICDHMGLSICELSGAVAHLFVTEMALSGHHRCAGLVLQRCVKHVLAISTNNETQQRH